MEINVSTKEFMNALNATGNVISNKTIEPILRNVLLTIKDGKAYLVATNLMQNIKSGFGTAEVPDFKAVLPHALLKDIVSTMKMKENLKLVLEEKSGYIQQGKSKYTISFLRGEAFAEIPDVQDTFHTEFDIDVFKKMIHSTLFAVDKKEESRKEFGGVYISSNNNELSFVSTNSTVLAVNKLSMTVPNLSIIVPWKAMDVFSKSASGDKVMLSSDGKQVKMVSGNMALSSLLINGVFPPYENIIPKTSVSYAVIDKNLITDALSRLNVIAKRGNRKVTLDFSSNNIIKAFTGTSEIGKGQEEIPFEGTVKDKIVFYGETLIDGISHVSSDKVKMLFNGSLSPVKVQGEDDSFVCVIMPQKTV